MLVSFKKLLLPTFIQRKICGQPTTDTSTASSFQGNLKQNANILKEIELQANVDILRETKMSENQVRCV